ncbi:MAG: hypothetical protein ABFC62_05930 [Clostridiaceae bacterium]|nr:hypothetical protein [Eubacteriales bacterium]
MDQNGERQNAGANSVEITGQSYSANEQDLIRQLVQSRLEQKAKLEFENFDGYELPPRTQFSMLKKPSVSIKYGKMTFNMASIRLFEGVKHILTIVHPLKRRLSIVTCSEEESASVEWARLKNDAWVNKDISSLEFIEKIYRMMNWDRGCRYKILGRIAASPKGLILIFDLPEAIMFTALLNEYVDTLTGEIKKRQIKYYPDEYKDRIGKSYNDYAASQQLNLFESFEGYAGQTYADAATAQVSAALPVANDVSAQSIPLAPANNPDTGSGGDYE